jgi:hypothetical protein
MVNINPFQIIHLKRFNFVNNKWVKSQKVVNFPFDNFDPTQYLASVPQETILRHTELQEMKAKNIKNFDCNDEITEFDLENDMPNGETSENGVGKMEQPKVNGQSPRYEKPPTMMREAHNSINATRRKRLVSTSLTKTPVVDSELVDYNSHKLVKNSDPFDLKYKLYAVVVSLSMKFILNWILTVNQFSVTFRWNALGWSLHCLRFKSKQVLVLLQRLLVPGDSVVAAQHRPEQRLLAFLRAQKP